jgi:hypothetical protein
MAGIPGTFFADEFQVCNWLQKFGETQAAAYGRVIATRALLRAIPFFGSPGHEKFVRRTLSQGPLLSIFRASHVAWASCRYPEENLQSAADAAANSLEEFGDPLSRAAYYAAKSAATPSRIEHCASSIGYAGHSYSKLNEDFWQAITSDANMVAQGYPIQTIAQSELWDSAEITDWFEFKDAFMRYLITGLGQAEKPKDNWMPWASWFDDCVASIDSFKLPFDISKQINLRIVHGDHEPGFWLNSPLRINDRIWDWIEESRNRIETAARVFISYNSADVITAKDVGSEIESFGFQTFAQFKDMPSGSNFISEMQDGLASMGKFSPLYSPEYMASEICQAEWNAAYNMDRLGKRRLIIGFLLKPTALLPLQKQVVHVPLYGLTREKARAAIFQALTGNGEPASFSQSRKDASESASPEPVIDANGKLGVSPDAGTDAAFVDDELARLPESMRKLLASLIASLPSKNAPVMLTHNLSDYRTELLINGASPRIADLIRSAEIIKVEIKDAIDFDAAWYQAGIKLALEQFLELHERLRLRFPVMMLRDQFIERSAIDPSVFDKPEFANQHKKLGQAASDTHSEDITTEEFSRVLEWRERQRKDIASLQEPLLQDSDDIFLTDKDRVLPATIKKRFLFDISGTGDKLLERAANVTKIADSGAGQTLIGATRELLKLIWGS